MGEGRSTGVVDAVYQGMLVLMWLTVIYGLVWLLFRLFIPLVRPVLSPLSFLGLQAWSDEALATYCAQVVVGTPLLLAIGGYILWVVLTFGSALLGGNGAPGALFLEELVNPLWQLATS